MPSAYLGSKAPCSPCLTQPSQEEEAVASSSAKGCLAQLLGKISSPFRCQVQEQAAQASGGITIPEGV